MDISHHCPEERFRRLCYRLWLLKNSFCGLLTEKFVCKLLNFGSALTRKFAEITGLIPFSTATPVSDDYRLNQSRVSFNGDQRGDVHD